MSQCNICTRARIRLSSSVIVSQTTHRQAIAGCGTDSLMQMKKRLTITAVGSLTLAFMQLWFCAWARAHLPHPKADTARPMAPAAVQSLVRAQRLLVFGVLVPVSGWLIYVSCVAWSCRGKLQPPGNPTEGP